MRMTTPRETADALPSNAHRHQPGRRRPVLRHGAFDRTPDCVIFPDTRWEPYAGQLARDDPRNFFYVPELPGENEQ